MQLGARRITVVTSCTQVNSALHPSGVAKSSTSLGWGKGGKVTSAGWQVTLCDLIWHVISRSGVVISITNCYIRFTLLYLLTLPLQECTAERCSSTRPGSESSCSVLHSTTWSHHIGTERASLVAGALPFKLVLLSFKANVGRYPLYIRDATTLSKLLSSPSTLYRSHWLHSTTNEDKVRKESF